MSLTTIRIALTCLVFARSSVSQNNQASNVDNNKNSENIITQQYMEFTEDGDIKFGGSNADNSQIANIADNINSTNIVTQQKIKFPDAPGMEDVPTNGFDEDVDDTYYQDGSQDSGGSGNTNRAIGINMGDTVADSGKESGSTGYDENGDLFATSG